MYKISLKKVVFLFNILKKNSASFMLFFIAVFLLASCKKEIHPLVKTVFLTPAANLIANFSDTIYVSGSISSDYAIQKAVIQLTDNNFTPISPAIELTLQSTDPHSFETDYVLENDYANTGNYLLNITVLSENEVSNFYRLIFINEIPRTTKKILLVTGQITNPQLSELNNLTPTFISSFSQTFLDLKIDSRYKLIYMCGKEKIEAISSSNYVDQFALSPLAINSDSFTSVDQYKNLIRLCRNDGNILSYNQLGRLDNQTGENLFFRPIFSYVNGNYLYAYILKNGSSKIAVFFYPSGVARQELLIDFEPLAFKAISETEVLIFGNKNGHVLVYKYLTLGNTVQLLKDIPSTKLNNAYSINTSTTLLLTSNGIYKYDIPTNSVILVNTTDFSGVSFDEVNDILYCFSATNIQLLQGTSFAILNNITVADTVRSIGVLYSK